MRLRALKQSCLAITQIIAVAVCLSAWSAAQTPSPSPTPAAPSTNTTLSETLTKLAKGAAGLATALETELEGPIMPFLERLSLLVAALIMIAAFAKLWRENSGAGVDLFWWFARLGVIFALLGNGPRIVDEMSRTGRTLASQGMGGAATTLFTFYEARKKTFEKEYGNFTTSAFTVNNGNLGVTSSDETSLQSPDRSLGAISISRPRLLDIINIPHSVISLGDLFLVVLSQFLLIAMRLAAPVMIAVAIDRGLAQQATYPYLWGVVVLTLIWPVVELVVKSAAYMVATIGLAVVAGKQMYNYDPTSLHIFHNGSQQPVYTVGFAAATMLFAGISMWATPYIAYQLSAGKLYEVASSMASMVGNGIQYYGASLAASAVRQAVIPQAPIPVSAPKSETPNARAIKMVNITGGAKKSPPLRTLPVAPVVDQQVLSERLTRGIETNPAANTQQQPGRRIRRY